MVISKRNKPQKTGSAEPAERTKISLQKVEIASQKKEAGLKETKSKALPVDTTLDLAKTLSEREQAEQEEKERQKMPDFQKDRDIPSTGRNLFILFLVIAGIFVLSFGSFTLYNKLSGAGVISIDDLHKENLGGNLDDEEGYVYNGYSFVFADGLWWTEMDKFGTLLKVPLHFGPKEVEKISTNGTLDSSFNEGEEIYLAIDPTVADKYYTLALSELSFNVVKGLDRMPVGSCTKENWACENRTVISCDSEAASESKGKDVIELALGNETVIEASGSCIKVTGSGYDLVKAVDRLLYQWYGIMN